MLMSTRTYAAHVHNAIVDVLLVDLVRELGALALDRDPRSASIAAALHTLDNPQMLADLQARNNIIAPVLIKDDEVDEATKARIQETVRQELRRDNLERLAEFQSNISTLRREVLESETAKRIWEERTKSVAHYDLKLDGADWRARSVGESGLTYGALYEFVDKCTVAVQLLDSVVRHSGYDFAGNADIASRNAKEYCNALSVGLQQTRANRDVGGCG